MQVATPHWLDGSEHQWLVRLRPRGDMSYCGQGRTIFAAGAEARWIELNADATEAAVRLLLRAGEHGATAPEHYLMPKHLSRVKYGPSRGKRGYDPTQHQSYWDSAWASLTEEAGLAGLRFHDLRQFITQMVERDVPLGLIQAMVGHISSRMLRRYTHISSGAARKAVEAFDTDPILTPTVTEEQAKGEKVYRA